MDLQLLVSAPFAVQLHLLSAVAAFAIGCANLLRLKGTATHKFLGWAWVALMLVVAISSFWIHDIDIWNGFSPIHLISIYVLVTVPYGIWHIRRGNIEGHRSAMVATFVGGLVIAGLLTLVPAYPCAGSFARTGIVRLGLDHRNAQKRPPCTRKS